MFGEVSKCPRSVWCLTHTHVHGRSVVVHRGTLARGWWERGDSIPYVSCFCYFTENHSFSNNFMHGRNLFKAHSFSFSCLYVLGSGDHFDLCGM